MTPAPGAGRDAVADAGAVFVCRGLRRTFPGDHGAPTAALDDVSIDVRRASLTALVGPDGAGKTTLLRVACGLVPATAGEMRVLGIDVAREPQRVQSLVGYMPQRFGLYEDLSVLENLNLYADLHGVVGAARAERYERLLRMTALAPFTARLAGRLSGGMKQKLGLACALLRSPELLLLDEPTAGVDPLSRRELWEIVRELVDGDGATVVVSTAYLDEAERCDHVVVLHRGRVLAKGTPADVSAAAAGRAFLAETPPTRTARGLQARLLDDAGVVDAVPDGGRVRFVAEAEVAVPAGVAALAGVVATPTEPRFEDGFMVLLRRAVQAHAGAALGATSPVAAPAATDAGAEPAVQVRDLVRRFGPFTAVDHLSFDVRRGEVFGLLGANGAGKTTTFRMLCGLLPATSGTLHVAGVDVRRASASARQRIGYVAQRFSLYGQLSVTENLEFFASAYGLRGARRRERIRWAIDQFDLADVARVNAGEVPGGQQRRLAMAAALLHEPDILFLDEPTSGADPLARREFWRRITDFAEHGVTVIVTTHFLEEAEYCDSALILDAGRLLAQGTPGEIRRLGRPEPGRRETMEDAFVAVVREARAAEADAHTRGAGAA